MPSKVFCINFLKFSLQCCFTLSLFFTSHYCSVTIFILSITAQFFKCVIAQFHCSLADLSCWRKIIYLFCWVLFKWFSTGWPVILKLKYSNTFSFLSTIKETFVLLSYHLLLDNRFYYLLKNAVLFMSVLFIFAVFVNPLLQATRSRAFNSKTFMGSASHCLSSLHQLWVLTNFTSNNRLVFYACCP